MQIINKKGRKKILENSKNKIIRIFRCGNKSQKKKNLNRP